MTVTGLIFAYCGIIALILAGLFFVEWLFNDDDKDNGKDI